MPLRSARLDLFPARIEHLEAELRSPESLGKLLGVEVPEGWPPGEYDREAVAFFRDRLREAAPGEEDWFAWYAVLREVSGERGILVAGAGYLGPPSKGAVELGYSVLPAYQGRGFATEIVQALALRAFSDPRVRALNAHTSASNLASRRVLERCGFYLVGPEVEGGSLRYRLSPR